MALFSLPAVVCALALLQGCAAGDLPRTGATVETETGGTETGGTDTEPDFPLVEPGGSGLFEGDVPCLAVQPDPGMPNHAMPWGTAIDPAGRRGYSTAWASMTLATFDLDTLEVLEVEWLAEHGLDLGFPLVVVGEGGESWTYSPEGSLLIRRGPEGDFSRVTMGPGTAITSVVPASGGGVLVMTAVGDEGSTLQQLDGLGGVVQSTFLDQRVTGLVELNDRSTLGLLVSGEGGTGVEVVGVSSPEQRLMWCELPAATDYGVQLDSGRIIVGGMSGAFLAGCEGDEPTTQLETPSLQAILDLGDTALLMMRDDGVGQHGVALIVDDELVLQQDFSTAFKSVSGAIDPVTGLLWTNSESTNEVVAFDLATELPVKSMLLGGWVDGLVLDPAGGGAAVATGRIGGTIVRVEDHQVTARGTGIDWPFAPVFDDQGERLWVVSETEATVVELDPRSLQILVRIETGAMADDSHMFSGLAWSEPRGRLYFADPSDDHLVEIDPDIGVTNRWPLSDEELDWGHTLGRLAVFLPDADTVLVVRTSDHRVQTIELDTGEVLDTVWVGEVAEEGSALDTATMVRELGLLFIEGVAIDPWSLDVAADVNLDVAQVLAEAPGDEPSVYALSPYREALLRMGLDGELDARAELAEPLHAESVFRPLVDSEQILIGTGRQATLCWEDLDW